MKNIFNQLTIGFCLTWTFLLAGCDSGPASETDTSNTETDAAVVATVDAAVVEGAGHTAGAMVVQSTDESEDVFLVANSFDTVTATVVSVDLANRSVVLRDADGMEGTVVVGEEARNLDQVKPGDTVVAEMLAQVSVYLVKDPNMELGEAVREAQLRAEKGEMPMASKLSETVGVYEVSSINLENNTFTLTSAAGDTQEFTAQNPANLAKGSVGDRVLVEKSIISAIKVEPAE